MIAAIARVFARPLLLLSFDPEQADIAGWPARRVELLMLVMVTICVVMSFQTVGTLLVFGMLLAPAGSGALLARRVPAMMLWGATIGSLSVYIGLLISYHFNLAAGASVVVVAVAIFFVIFTVQATAAGPERATRTDGDGVNLSPSRCVEARRFGDRLRQPCRGLRHRGDAALGPVAGVGGRERFGEVDAAQDARRIAPEPVAGDVRVFGARPGRYAAAPRISRAVPLGQVDCCHCRFATW